MKVKSSLIYKLMASLLFFILVSFLSFSEPSSEAFGNAVVESVADGDTISVLMDGKKESIRFIGINTPEVAHFGEKEQCFGKEAQAFLRSQLKKGDTISLQEDLTQDDRDKYGRLLRYVYKNDGTFLNELLVSQGYAREYTYKIPYQFQSEFKKAQMQAKQELRGLWDECK